MPRTVSFVVLALVVAALLAPTRVLAQASFTQSQPDNHITAEERARPCSERTDVLGVSRIVEIDTSTAPRFGEQYPGSSFLADGEVVLTFDDGPMRRYTLPILDALDGQCTKATFFSVGQMAIADSAMLKEVARRGHTIGFHTWSHRNVAAAGAAGAKREIELGLSAVSAALGEPIAPFFRFPYLAYNKANLTYLAGRGIATFGIDVDSKDFLTRNPGNVMRKVLDQLDKKKKGIILFHDIHSSTAGAIASLLAELNTRGFKVVQVVPAGHIATLPEFDAIAAKALAAKTGVAAADPMATKAVTWSITTPAEAAPVPGATPAAAAATAPATAGAPATPAAGAPAVQAATPAAPNLRPRHSRRVKTNWSNVSNDPWQLKSYGIAGGP